MLAHGTRDVESGSDGTRTRDLPLDGPAVRAGRTAVLDYRSLAATECDKLADDRRLDEVPAVQAFWNCTELIEESLGLLY